MTNLDTPMDFQIEKDFGNHKLKYIDLTEICQGGPEIGNITIDNKVIPSAFFGGPAISENNFLYIPKFEKAFLKSGFMICRINLQTLETITFGKIKDIIFFDKIENNVINYYEDLNRNKKSFYKLPE
ncbi:MULTISPECIES: hypothetical protein [Flavobacterium]|uniref:Uncharacterized protein n=1 Tax=Flavobacterium keumense TaxID=1306518 RepID=A0ABY8N679_9FLAO|nr:MULTISPECIES: hypothetical protein [Flavobacterium]WGK95150.1 hypothetical protein MG292_02665 [Flavobacterium keumense]